MTLNRLNTGPAVALMVTTLVVLVAGPFGAISASAAPMIAARAKVINVYPTPATLGPAGGKVYVQGYVSGAVSCHLKVVVAEDFTVLFSHAPRSCTDNTFGATVVIGPNPAEKARTVTLALVAGNDTSSWTKQLSVHVLSPALTAKLSLSPSVLPSSGGTATFTLSSTRGVTCTLTSSPVLWSGSNPFPVDCNGGYSVPVSATSVAQEWDISFKVVSASGLTAVATAVLLQYAPPLTPPTTSPPPTSSGPQVVPYTSNNWSGYAVRGGPFTSVSGTFIVPYETTEATCDDRLSDWVGIDGWGSTQGTLLQAGIDESEQDPSTGQCGNNEFWTWAWWEIVPSLPTPEDSVLVHAGDTVTVSLMQLSPGEWQISLTDNTDGQGFSVQQPYTGPAETAEWITEAAGDDSCGSGIAPAPDFPGYVICPLAPYSPPVTFSGLQLPQSSNVTEVDEIDMVQSGVTVSTPSTTQGLSNLLSNGFTDSYSGP